MLRHVFDIAPELIKEPADLLRVLLRRHYHKRRVPAMLDAHLVLLLRQHGQFQDWPLERIVPDLEAFFSFLQQRWPRFLKRWLQQHQQPDMAGAASELAAEPVMAYVDPEDLPFDHDDVRVYIDNLFLEGHLKPLAATDLGMHLDHLTLPAWLAVGLRLDPATDRLRRLQGFIASLESSIPVPADCRTWGRYPGGSGGAFHSHREARRMSTPVPVGFSQRLQLDWLEHTSTLVLAGHTRDHIVTTLQDLLRHELSVGGTAPRGNREKAITMLLRIWVSVPRHLRSFRDEGLEHVQRLPVDDRIAVHWGMAMAVYPFFGAVAAAVGRLVRLQVTCAAAHVQRRVREQLGERETVARAVRRTLRCFVDWGTLLETGERGVYQAAPARPVQDKKLVVWLTEAALLTSRLHTGVLTALAQAPALFPFHLASLYAVDLAGHSRLEPFCHGLNEDIVRFR